MPAWKNPLLPVGLKPCPHCRGTGQVPRAGGRRDEFVAKSLAWAKSWHGEMGTVRTYTGQLIPGLAVAYVAPGGWGGVRVFTPKPIYQQPAGKYPFRITEEDHRYPLPFRTVSWGNRDHIAPLEYWEDVPELAALKKLPGPLMPGERPGPPAELPVFPF